MLKLKYKGKTRSGSAGGQKYQEVYYGSKSEVEQRAEGLTIGERHGTGRYELASWKMRQSEGPFHELELNWESCHRNGIRLRIDGHHGPEEHTLDISMTMLPLERNAQYRTCWNYCLAAKDTDTVPSWWSSATDPILTENQREHYRWIRNPDTPAFLPEEWHLLKMRTMTAEGFLMPSYVITEYTHYRSIEKAAWAATQKAGKLCTPELGDFGLNLGLWLCLGGQVTYDGKRWTARILYKSSPDPSGWSNVLYETAAEAEEEDILSGGSGGSGVQ